MEKQFMCLFCVSECPDHFWFWQKKKKMEQNGVLTLPPLWNMFHLKKNMICSPSRKKVKFKIVYEVTCLFTR